LMRDMGAPIVQDQMNASSFGIAPFELAHAPQEMVRVIFLQTPPQHRPIIDIKGYQEVDEPLALILELAPFNASRAHRLGRGHAPQSLDVGFLIHTDHHFPPAREPVHCLGAPQDLGRQSHEFLIQPSRLPVPTARGLQAGLGQNVGYRRVVDGIAEGLLDHNLLQAATIPSGHVQPVGLGGGARYVFDRAPLQRGKRLGGVRCGEHQRSPLRPAAGSGATNTISSYALRQSRARGPRSVLPGPRPTTLAHAGPRAVALAHRGRPAPRADALQPSPSTHAVCVLSSAAPPLRDRTIRSCPSKRNLLNYLCYSPLVRCREKEISSILAHPFRPDSESPPVFGRLSPWIALQNLCPFRFSSIRKRAATRCSGLLYFV